MVSSEPRSFRQLLRWCVLVAHAEDRRNPSWKAAGDRGGRCLRQLRQQSTTRSIKSIDHWRQHGNPGQARCKKLAMYRRAGQSGGHERFITFLLLRVRPCMVIICRVIEPVLSDAGGSGWCRQQTQQQHVREKPAILSSAMTVTTGENQTVTPAAAFT